MKCRWLSQDDRYIDFLSVFFQNRITIPVISDIMIIEANRLQQKIKRLKEELTRERELRKEAERLLKIFKDSASCIVPKNQILEFVSFFLCMYLQYRSK